MIYKYLRYAFFLLISFSIIFISACADNANADGAAPLSEMKSASNSERKITKKIPLSISKNTDIGASVRIKGIDISEDFVALDISLSFSHKMYDSASFAFRDVFIEDESGGRLFLRRLEDNEDLEVSNGETLNGKLVFMGQISASTNQIRLVFNDGGQKGSALFPAFSVNIPLENK